MNKNLARTLTTAIVKYIDSERPGGTMCCSNVECERLEKALEEDEYKYVEAFIQKKLSRLTEFEKRLFEIRHIAKRDMYSDQEWQTLRNESAELLSLAREELFANDTVLKEYAEKARKKGEAEALKKFEAQCKFSSDIEHGLAYVLGYKAGRADALIDEITKIPSFNEEKK